MQQRNATKPRVNTVRGVPLVGRGKPSLGAHKAKQPPGHALTQRGTTQRRPARRRATKGVTAVGRSGKGSTTVGWPGWFPRVVTETDTGHEGPERPRGPTGGPLAATDGERRVGRALPRHGHALPTEPAILEFSNSTPLFQLRSSEVLGANVAPRTHGGRRLPGRPPGECAPRSTEAGADAAPRQGARPRATTAAQAPTQRSTKCPT